MADQTSGPGPERGHDLEDLVRHVESLLNAMTVMVEDFNRMRGVRGMPVLNEVEQTFGEATEALWRWVEEHTAKVEED
jgi:hypothetical protein